MRADVYFPAMILTGQLLLPEGREGVRLAPGWLEMHSGVIEVLEEGEIRRDADFGDADSLITPGFFDAHMHLAQVGAIGAHGRNLLEWLDEVIFPAETRWGEPAYAKVKGESALRQLLAHGTVGCAANATVHYIGAETALCTAAQLGMRAAIGLVMMDMESPSELSRPTHQLIEETAALLEAWPRYDAKGQMRRVCASVNPRFAVTCSEELLRKSAQLASRHRVLVQTHLAELPGECERACELHGVERYTDIYLQAGLLGEHSLLAHGIWLDEQECSCLAGKQAVVVHCPVANGFLRSGVMNRALWGERGMRLALGSDVGAGYELSMVRNARSMLNAAFYAGGKAPAVAQAWWQVTRGNALCLGWEDAGELRVGLSADVLVHQPMKGWRQAPDPLGFLMFAWDDRWLQEVFLRGMRFLQR